MTGRDLCDQCNGMGYTGCEDDGDEEVVCDLCGGDGIQ